MQDCWAADLAQRPAFAELARSLQAMLQTLARGARPEQPESRRPFELTVTNPAFSPSGVSEL